MFKEKELNELTNQWRVGVGFSSMVYAVGPHCYKFPVSEKEIQALEECQFQFG